MCSISPSIWHKFFGTIDDIDISQEKRSITQYMKVLGEYQKILNNEKKRRDATEVIENNEKVAEIKAQIKNKKRKRQLTFGFDIFSHNLQLAFGTDEAA